MAKSAKLQRSADNKNVSLNYKALPGWMPLSAFSASFISAALLLILSFPVEDRRICPPELANALGSRNSAQQLNSVALWLQKKISPLSELQQQFALEQIPTQEKRRGIRPHRWWHSRQITLGMGFEDRMELASAQDQERYICTWSALLLFTCGSFLLAMRLREKRLLISQERLRFPSGLLIELGGRLERRWEEITALGLSNNSGHDDIEFYFNGGAKASLNVQKLSQADLDSLFNMIDLFAPQVQKSPELIVFRQQLFSAHGKLAFTQIWEEELQARFAATNFVALKKGSTLQNGRLKVALPLSSGGLSAVYLVERAGGMAVLKESVVPEGTGEQSRQKAKELFAREASMLISLEHPHIARVLDYFQEDDRDYLLLEYIPGVTLREYLRRHGAQSEEKVARWAGSIASILNYLHSQDPPVIHRDLTPDNLMITPSGEIVLIDFGAANQYLGNATGTIVGKQFYISPEQFRGKATPASDIYSLGGTIFFLLTGMDPDALAVAKPANVRSDVSTMMNDLVARCTALDEKQRLSNSDDLIRALDAISSEVEQSKSGCAESSVAADSAAHIELKQEERIYR